MDKGISAVIGVDLGDRSSQVCVLDVAEGAKIEERRVVMDREGLRAFFGGRSRSRVAMEVGTHSPWVSRLVASLGHEVLVANARELRMIYGSKRKTDRADAEVLARVARLDPSLLRPIAHRGEEAQAALVRLRNRDALVRARSALIASMRGSLKSLGLRLPACSTASFHRRAAEHLPEAERTLFAPLLESIATLSDQIRQEDREVERMCEEDHPETQVLRQVKGVGPLTALAFVLTLETPDRFRRSRDVGPYLGLTPRRDQSGETDKQLGITKAGDAFLRRTLLQAAHYILGPFGPPTDLRGHGERIAERGGPRARKRAVVAVARKLAVLLHALWKTGEVYEPTRKEPQLG